MLYSLNTNRLASSFAIVDRPVPDASLKQHFGLESSWLGDCLETPGAAAAALEAKKTNIATWLLCCR